MTRRVPVVATLVVALAVATMIALGFWQLDRRAEKEAILRTYAAAGRMAGTVPWPRSPGAHQAALYRRSALHCDAVSDARAVSGRSISGRSGWAHIATCHARGGLRAEIAMGWSPGPRSPRWLGGEVTGVVAPAGRGIRLVADPPVAGLAALAAPDPATIPNNHLSYAVQWFAFAATALAIYALALGRRWRGPAADG